MTDWQPIETAPRDGAVVLLKAVWNGEDLMPPIRGKWSTDKTRGGGPGMVRDGWIGENGNPFAVSYDPTHWQPLPPPPKG